MADKDLCDAEIDRRIQSLLATDAAYRNAENAELQAEREAAITREVCELYEL